MKKREHRQPGSAPAADPLAAAIAHAESLGARLRRDQPMLIGVSGGRDSVALLHAMAKAGYNQLIVCHLDHALRGGSAEEAYFVAELAGRYALGFESERVNVKELADEEGLSIETAAREARYEFFGRVARAYWCPRVILAHHADDQIETLLLNLLRGTGRTGLAGMRPLSVQQRKGGLIEIHRPLLDVWRHEIDTYVVEHALEFREDPSNVDRLHARNRIRLDALPALQTALGRDVKATLHRAAEILGAEEDFLATHTPLPPAGPLEVESVKPLPVAIQRRLIHRWLQVNLVADLSFDDVERVRGLLVHVQPAKVNLSHGRHARRRTGQLFIE
jgi:tRNA(Ile)-lysidine synthase